MIAAVLVTPFLFFPIAAHPLSTHRQGKKKIETAHSHSCSVVAELRLDSQLNVKL